MENMTVKDYLDSVEDILKECNLIHGKFPSSSATRGFTVIKYSILYLIKNKKIKFTDSVEAWYSYLYKFELSDHYKVANAFLIQSGKTPLDFSESIYLEKVCVEDEVC